MSSAVVRGLLRAGIDVVTVAGLGRRGLGDGDHLDFAASQGRVIYSANVRHFAAIHSRWLRGGRHHAGIVLLHDQLTPVGVQIRALLRLSAVFDTETMQDGLEYLGDWIG